MSPVGQKMAGGQVSRSVVTYEYRDVVILELQSTLRPETSKKKHLDPNKANTEEETFASACVS